MSLNLIKEVPGLQQEEYMRENCRGNKYFLMNLDTEVRKNGLVTKIWLCKVVSEKRGWQVTKSPPLNPPLHVRNINVLTSYEMPVIHFAVIIYPADNYMFKVNNSNNKTKCGICSKFTAAFNGSLFKRLHVWEKT